MSIRCPLCSRRAAKRNCPAKGVKICSVCCGTKREVEIDCPSGCIYLGDIEPPGRAAALVEQQRFGPQFLRRHSPLLTALVHAILDERETTPGLVDQDAASAFSALAATMKTLSAGIYYETLPASGLGALAVYRRLKSLLDELMQPGDIQRDTVRSGDAVEVLEFMRLTLELHSSGRPRSRRYLDWLNAMAPDRSREDGRRLILP